MAKGITYKENKTLKVKEPQNRPTDKTKIQKQTNSPYALWQQKLPV